MDFSVKPGPVPGRRYMGRPRQYMAGFIEALEKLSDTQHLEIPLDAGDLLAAKRWRSWISAVNRRAIKDGSKRRYTSTTREGVLLVGLMKAQQTAPPTDKGGAS